uniref:C-type lectin domain-containing protein n=1 Tax=Cyprinus carpio TaxID=7962 RepID=A0A8C2A2C0_CYPCA
MLLYKLNFDFPCCFFLTSHGICSDLRSGLFLKTSCYFVLIQEPKTWTEAQSYCKQYHWDLATIQSDEDRYKIQEVAAAAKFQNRAWMGLYDGLFVCEAWIGLSKNLWLWSDQSKVTWLSVKWADGQPDNASGNEMCGFVNETGLIGDDGCSHTLPFFCSEFHFCFNP